MPDVTLEQAALVLGVSVDTVRRRVRLGKLTARRDETGRSLVSVPGAPITPADLERLGSIERDNAHLRELIGELRRQQAQLLEHNAVLREQLAAASEAQLELRRLLSRSQEHIGQLLAGSPRQHRGTDDG